MRHWAASGTARAACALAGALLLASSVAAAWSDPSARAFRVPLDRAVRHEIVPDALGLGRVLAAPEGWVFLDLLVPDGRAEALRLDFDGGAAVAGGDLRPTMPTFGLATVRGHRDPQAFRQWWAARFRPDMVRDGKLAVTIRDASGRSSIFGDLLAPRSEGIDRGPSLGQWPFLSVYRLMHDGEYRLPARQPLRGSRSSEAAGRRLPGALGVRLVILDPAAGPAPWAAGPTQRPWRPLLVY
jgi:hypothetical protein